MARINIPLDALTSRLNLGGRFDSMSSQTFGERFSNLKPPQDFFDFRRFSRPASFSVAQERINFNLTYFSSNYSLVFVILCLWSLYKNWYLLLALIVIIGGMWAIGRLNGGDLVLGPVHATGSQLYGVLALVSIPLLWWASPVSSVLWLIGASAVAILGHGCMMEKPIAAEFGDEV